FVLSQNQTLRKCLHGTGTTEAGRQPTHETIPKGTNQIRLSIRAAHPRGEQTTRISTKTHHITAMDHLGIDYLAHC
ncbi:hypothetical protein, partial [Cellulomonas sp.]|uniref:hypothetical protein n=1 Tax=Cellulomonas sp. TaxID=40001 RepID=UPI001B0EF657